MGYLAFTWRHELSGTRRWVVIELNCVCRDLSWPARVVGRAWQLAWLYPHARVTRRLAQSVARFCNVAPVRHSAA